MNNQSSISELEDRFDALFTAIEKYFRLRGFGQGAAADLAAEVFERSLLARNGYDAGKASLKTWLFTIAHNLAINEWKSAQNRTALGVSVGLADRAPLPEERVVKAEQEQELLAAVQRLAEREREVVALKFAARLSNGEIAALLGLSAGNVGVILFRALKQVKTELTQGQGEVKDE